MSENGRRGLKFTPPREASGKADGFFRIRAGLLDFEKKKFDLITGSLGFVQYFYLEFGFLI